jgi:hypothetical protein
MVVFFGVPILSVMSWIVGGLLGFIVLGVVAILVFFYLLANKPEQ